MSNGDRVISGLYKKTAYGRTLEARLDVDGTYPQMKLSLTLTNTSPGTWIADMESAGNNRWEGDVWYRKSQVGATNDEMDTVVTLNSGPFDKLLAQYGGLTLLEPIWMFILLTRVMIMAFGVYQKSQTISVRLN